MSEHPYPPSHGLRSEAIDPDVDLHAPAQRIETEGPRKWKVLAVVAAGGAIGASTRYGVSQLWPSVWATFAVNAFGCLLIGVLMVLVSERGVVTRPLVRPFLGVGVLGGFTTFSAYVLDFARLLERHRAGALLYAAATLAAAMGAVWLGASAARRLVDRRRSAP
ncbi:fluoride efflux transporter FluC [Streptomyces marianii]|uniref:Fluoride-specific ion channel FluC n=1 Tax=Streptomyces marianii TaxID=1817406 RepID=A0A5R9EAM9_9ACTN|nr:CrcB family protein [Streptomyces marianii]TLQ45033.1 CrcB family protein [Streptomyces marianii]